MKSKQVLVENDDNSYICIRNIKIMIKTKYLKNRVGLGTTWYVGTGMTEKTAKAFLTAFDATLEFEVDYLISALESNKR